ncbi:hypothetical protein AB832_01090 [Flavobacteriaceae bacterium (ex Bugula neritina AB1)]|nr:hypothetical protein AB832_01090 [Flavobacteriaceae bacterium (ex Bugula neritina AB1)]
MKKQCILKNLQKSIVAIVCTLLLLSCEKEDNFIAGQENSSQFFELSNLPEKPSFAKDIENKEEVRKFTITTKEEQLHFTLKPVFNANFFGKKRFLMGNVSINGKDEKATMTLGENGFLISYQKEEEEFEIVYKERLELGQNKLNTEIKSILEKNKNNTEFLSQLRKKGMSYSKVYDQFNTVSKKRQISANEKVMESGQNYSIINTTQERDKNSFTHASCTIENNIIKNSGFINTKVAPRTFYTHVVVDKTYDEKGYGVLTASLIEHMPDLTINIWALSNDQIIGFDPTNPTTLTNFSDFLQAVAQVKNSIDQLNKWRNHLVKRMKYLPKQGAFGLLKEDRWKTQNGEISYGSAYTGAYNYNEDYSDQSTRAFSSYIACDNNVVTIGHEIGHLLGAKHVNNATDIMAATIDIFTPSRHKDANNIKAIKSTLGR